MDLSDSLDQKAWAKAVKLGWTREKWEKVWARIIALGPFKQGELWKKLNEAAPLPKHVTIPKQPRIPIVLPVKPSSGIVDVGPLKLRNPT